MFSDLFADSRCLSYAHAPILSVVLHLSVSYEVIVVLEIILNVSEHIRRIMIISRHQKQNNTSIIQPRTFDEAVLDQCTCNV